MADLNNKTSKRICRCRLCGRDIGKEEVRMVIESVTVSPKVYNLHFCNACCALIGMYAKEVVDTDQ